MITWVLQSNGLFINNPRRNCEDAEMQRCEMNHPILDIQYSNLGRKSQGQRVQSEGHTEGEKHQPPSGLTDWIGLQTHSMKSFMWCSSRRIPFDVRCAVHYYYYIFDPKSTEFILKAPRIICNDVQSDQQRSSWNFLIRVCFSDLNEILIKSV